MCLDSLDVPEARSLAGVEDLGHADRTSLGSRKDQNHQSNNHLNVFIWPSSYQFVIVISIYFYDTGQQRKRKNP